MQGICTWVLAAARHDADRRHLVLGQRAGLVRANDGHAAERLHGRQLANNRLWDEKEEAEEETEEETEEAEAEDEEEEEEEEEEEADTKSTFV